MKKHGLSFLLAATVLAACTNPKTSNDTAMTTTTDSTHEIKVAGNKMISVDGKYNVWTKKIGEGKIKVLLLHGGPGFTHDYMEAFEDFLPKEGIEIYYYDQLGCGNSDIPSDTSLWNIPRFVEEVEQVRQGLGIDNFYIVGHSWGGLLALEYMHKYQSHVKGAVISNMTAGMKDFTSYVNELRTKYLSTREQAVYDSLDKKQQYSSPMYMDLLMNKLYTQVICRMPVEKWPEPVLRAFRKANTNVYLTMQGVDEFHVTGNFKNWEFWDRLPEVKVPTLVLGAAFDEMNPESMKRQGYLLPNSRTYICPNGSHMAMYDDQQNYFNNLVAFLKDVDANKFVADKK